MTPKSICTIEWITIPAPNLELAKRFYSELFGFQLSPYNDRFVVFTAGNISGGLDQDLQASAHGIGFSITVNAMNETIGKLAEFSCEILREPYQLGPNAGYCARFKDPNGNVLELYADTL